MEGFQSYLKNIGYDVVALKFPSGNQEIPGHDKLGERVRMTAQAVASGVDALAQQPCGPVVVVSASPVVVSSLERFLERRGRATEETMNEVVKRLKALLLLEPRR